jgi:hypothetical protein
LFDLILKSDWAAATKRVSSHPNEARYKHPRGYTMLHCAVESGAPLDFIKAMVHAYPEGVDMKDWKGRSVQDAALYEETTEFFKQYNSTNANDTEPIKGPRLMNDDNVLKIVKQVQKISNEVSSLEKSIQQLRNEMDVLVATLKGTS